MTDAPVEAGARSDPIAETRRRLGYKVTGGHGSRSAHAEIEHGFPDLIDLILANLQRS